ncbi:MAG: helix-turn-helix transcriptional regulator [Prevotella sp.]|nr:helix-turn-helix transcriptional regulator [Prevotella sp.]
MNYKDRLGIFPEQTSSQIQLLKYTKTSCGVDFMLNTDDGRRKNILQNELLRYKADFFEFFFFKKARGYVFVADRHVDLSDNMLLIISPYLQQEWHVDEEQTDYVFLVFQEEFINNFLSDQYFMYRLLYCYQTDKPFHFSMTPTEQQPFLLLLEKIRQELHAPVADSYHMIVAYLYEFLLHLNRFYAALFQLPLSLPLNNYAYQYKQLLETHVAENLRVQDYADKLRISRVSLNKAVSGQFGVSATHLLRQRLLQEIKNQVLFGNMTIKEVAVRLHFSEPNHMMRFFKQLTGTTITAFVDDFKRQQATPGGLH